MTTFKSLVTDVRSCTICAEHLQHGVRPVFQVSEKSRILIAGQAPGQKVHQSGVPFDDASGDRLRDWMGISREIFYDQNQIAILPMGFCYPGKGKSGDLPPRPECAPAWRDQLLSHLHHIEITLVIGQYAQNYHMKTKQSLTETVRNWGSSHSKLIPLPHPSPRNNIWLSKNPWFENELIPILQTRVSEILE
ncbi:MAG: uracil-DNA glycosylase family protein [Gammaproteobacteria bacterium]|nr:uracil-DNA glycosylase family protein [Gammaproteobacteria bacterium]